MVNYNLSKSKSLANLGHPLAKKKKKKKKNAVMHKMSGMFLTRIANQAFINGLLYSCRAMI